METNPNPGETTGQAGTVAAAILAGGAGTRIGGRKAETSLAGRPMIEYPLASLRRAGLDPFVVTKAGHRLDLGPVEIVIEPDKPLHPLLGIAMAIRAASGRPVLVVACDLPLLPPALLAQLATETGTTVVAGSRGTPQPLVARYGPDSLGTIEAALTVGNSVKSTLAELDPVIVDVSGPGNFGDPSVVFHNVNSPGDLARAEELLRGPGDRP